MRRTLHCAAVLALLATGVRGDEVSSWLERLASLYELAPFSIDYEMSLDAGQAAGGLSLAASGEALYGDRSRRLLNLRLEIRNEALPEPLEMTILSVADGETVWNEMGTPATGARQVVRVPQREQRRLAGASGFGSLVGGATMDPLGLLGGLADAFALEVVGREEGTVVLAGRAKAAQGLASDAWSASEVRLVLDEETAAPRHLRLGPADAPSLEARYRPMERLTPEEVPADAFVYLPPEGVAVAEPFGKPVETPE